VDVFPERRHVQLVLTAAVARNYHVDDASKVDLALEYGLSRSQVARLLDRWHDRAPVRTRWSPARLHTGTTTVGS
jgi:DNA-binding transcriptional regulator LsrR (DeoR family)